MTTATSALVVEKNADGTYPDGYTAELMTGKTASARCGRPTSR